MKYLSKNLVILSLMVVSLVAWSSANAAQKANQWYLKTMVLVQDGDEIFHDLNSGIFGRIKGASVGRDKYDIPVFQSVNGAKAAVVFLKDENDFPDASGQYVSDYRSKGRSRASWAFMVTTNRSSADVTLFWEEFNLIKWNYDGSYRTEVSNDDKVMKRLHLVDLETGEVTKARTRKGFKSYTFNMNGKTTRHFRWVVGKPRAEDFEAEVFQARNSVTTFKQPKTTTLELSTEVVDDTDFPLEPSVGN